jgi:MFS family permease
VLLTAFATSAYGLFLPALLQEFPWSRAQSVLPYSLAMIAWGVMQPVAGALADSRGSRPVILAGILLMGLGFIVMGIAQGFWLVAVGFGLLVGIATSACGFVPFALLISKLFARASRASGVGLVQAAIPAGPILIAPVLFLTIDSLGWRAGALVLGLLLIAFTFPLAYLGVHDPPAAGDGRTTGLPKGSWRQSLTLLRLPALRNVFLARVACGMSALMIAHLPASAAEYGLSPAAGAIAISVYGASAAVGSFLGGLAADRWGREPTLVATFFVRGLGTLALALLALDSFSFYVAVALATGPIFATVSINNVQIFEIVGARRAGFILGLSLVLHQVAAALGPYVTGLVFDWTGTYRVAFFGLAVVLLLATIPSARSRQEGPPAEAREDVLREPPVPAASAG